MTPRSANTDQDSGFTLVEVLVSFAILAGAIIVNMQVAVNGMRRLTQADEKLRALAVAQEVLAEAELNPPQGNELKEGREGEFAWRVEAKEMGDGTGNGQKGLILLVMRVSVNASRERDQRLIVLDSVVLQQNTLTP